MNFIEATQALQQRKKVRRKSWQYGQILYVNENNQTEFDNEYAINIDPNILLKDSLTEEDINADDWEILKDTENDFDLDEDNVEDINYEGHNATFHVNGNHTISIYKNDDKEKEICWLDSDDCFSLNALLENVTQHWALDFFSKLTIGNINEMKENDTVEEESED